MQLDLIPQDRTVAELEDVLAELFLDHVSELEELIVRVQDYRN
jgi:hypothetical protein